MSFLKNTIALVAVSTIGIAVYNHEFIPLAEKVASPGVIYLLKSTNDKEESKEDRKDDTK